MAADLKLIYGAATAEMAELAQAGFRVKYPKHQVVADVWERNWQRVSRFSEFPEEISKIIYTTNAVESLHMTLRKVTRNCGSFPFRLERPASSPSFPWRPRRNSGGSNVAAARGPRPILGRTQRGWTCRRSRPAKPG